MPLNTRSRKREPTETVVEYAIDETTEQAIKLNIPKDSINKPIAAVLVDVSIGGCAIDSPYIMPPGAILDLKIDPKPFASETGKDRKAPMAITGRVTSCIMKGPGHYRLGVSFKKIEKDDVTLIDEFIKIKERRQFPRWEMKK